MKTELSNSKKKKGFSIIEVQFAMSILAVVLSGVFILVFQVTNMGNDTEARTMAINYAQEAVEVVKQLKENSPCQFFGNQTGKFTIYRDATDPTKWKLKPLGAGGNIGAMNYTSNWSDIYGMGPTEKLATGMDSSLAMGRVIEIQRNTDFSPNIALPGANSDNHRVITVTVKWQSKGAPVQTYTTRTVLYNWKY